MPHLTLPISADGPVVHAEIGRNALAVAARVQAGQAPVQPVRARALMDTGADRTRAAPHVLRQVVSRQRTMCP